LPTSAPAFRILSSAKASVASSAPRAISALDQGRDALGGILVCLRQDV